MQCPFSVYRPEGQLDVGGAVGIAAGGGGAGVGAGAAGAGVGACAAGAGGGDVVGGTGAGVGAGAAGAGVGDVVGVWIGGVGPPEFFGVSSGVSGTTVLSTPSSITITMGVAVCVEPSVCATHSPSALRV